MRVSQTVFDSVFLCVVQESVTALMIPLCSTHSSMLQTSLVCSFVACCLFDFFIQPRLCRLKCPSRKSINLSRHLQVLACTTHAATTTVSVSSRSFRHLESGQIVSLMRFVLGRSKPN